MEKTNLTFTEVTRAISAIELPEVDHVVGIGRGGVVPASLIANKLGLDLTIVEINYRDDDNNPRHESPVTRSALSLPSGVKSILLVDDVSVSGSTLDKARELLNGYKVTTCVLKGKADHVVFPEISTCVNWPWGSPKR